MEQLLAGESPLDNEISAVRAQIEALRHRRSLLSHTLLSSRKFKSQLSQATSGPKIARASLDAAKDLITENENTTITNLHRTCSGITAFRVQDPDPNAVDGGNVLGIRFDVFSGANRAFQTPYYVLLNQPRADGQLKVHKHTIPVFVSMQAIARKHLPFQSEEDEDLLKAGQQKQDLPKFVRALRKELVSHHKQVEAFEGLKKSLGRRQGVEEVKMLDTSGKEIELVFIKGTMAQIRVASDGKIEKVAVGPSSSMATESPAGSMKAYREVKKAIEGGGGRIDDLAERLKRRSA